MPASNVTLYAQWTAPYSSFITNIQTPTGIAFDTSGNIYVGDSSNDIVNRYLHTGGSSPDLSLNVQDPAGLAFDISGNLYVCEGGSNGIIIKFTNASGTGDVYSRDYFQSGVQLTGIATYGDYIFAADFSNNAIYTMNRNISYTPDGSDNVIYTYTDSSGNVSAPYQLSYSSGYLFCANSGNSTISSFSIDASGQLTPSSLPATISTLATSSLTATSEPGTIPYGVVFTSIDGSNNTYFSDSSSNTIKIVTNSGTSTFIDASTNVTPTYLAVGSNERLYFSSPSDSSVYVTENPVCFNEDTKILCLNYSFEEEYIPIQDLKKGDLVKTYLHGYRRVDLTHTGVLFNNPNNWRNTMYKMEKTEENGLLEDLIVTGGHSILVDSISQEEQERLDKLGLSDFPVKYKFDNKYLLLASVSDHFIPLTDNKKYTYYHLTLENNGDDNQQFGIWANEVLTETTCKNYLLNHR
jgi:hypothetical protein